MTPEKSLWSLIVTLGIVIFCTAYSFLSDFSGWICHRTLDLSENSLLARIVIPVAVFVLLCVTGVTVVGLRRIQAKSIGFTSYAPMWFSKDLVKRIQEGRNFLNILTKQPKSTIIIATVSGEWDITKPFSEKELRQLRKDKHIHLRVLLAHPKSEGLRIRCQKEPDQDPNLMAERIVKNTKMLLEIGEDYWDVRWYLGSPTFHILANDIQMFFSPFVDGLSGHSMPRYEIRDDNRLYKALHVWFDGEWARALPAKNELEWVERDIYKIHAVFLDRDGTLIKDLCYHGDNGSAKIKVLPGVIEGLRRLAQANFRLIVVSNQHPVGLKLYTREELAQLTQRIKNLFRDKGVLIDAFYYCTHTEAQHCTCRKPQAGLLIQAQKDFDLYMGGCHLIGNSIDDSEIKKNLPDLNIHIVRPDKGFDEIVDEILRVEKQPQSSHNAEN
jgi:D-glycero-D-manno-heptose 1,7-bisphosphate phosphatase